MSVQRKLDLHFLARGVRIALERGNGLTHQADIQVESDALNMAGLLATQKVARATQFEVLHSQLVARTQFIVRRNRLEPLKRDFAQRTLRIPQEIRVGAVTATPHTATQLMKLRKAIVIRAVHDQRVRVSDIQPGFDDGRGDEHVIAALPEIHHDLFKPALRHATMRNSDPRFRHQLSELPRNLIDRGHPVVDVENLALTHQLAADRRNHLLVRARAHIRQNRVAFLRRGRQR